MQSEQELAWSMHQMKAVFEAELPSRLRRASRVKLQNFIPSHWFASAASECARMFIAGTFYGAISVSQAYVEALSKYVAELYEIPVRKDTEERCRRLHKAGVISDDALSAALSILVDRNDFHHLNKEVSQEYEALQQRAEDCVNHLHAIESEVFAYVPKDAGIELTHPDRWPSGGEGLAQVNIRQLW